MQIQFGLLYALPVGPKANFAYQQALTWFTCGAASFMISIVLV
jgi:hypothetical protein